MNASNYFTRRDVLATGSAAAGFTFLPARVLGRGSAIPPSEKLNVAFIGLGCRGAINIKELSSQNVVAVCDCDWRPIAGYQYRRACDVALEYPQAKRYDDWRILLQEQDKNIDAVLVASADHTHAIASITAMKMGKHVYCEKPLAHSMHEVCAMMAAEKKYKVTTQTGNQGHSSEDCRMMVDWIRDGAIGAVQEVHLFEGAGRPPRTDYSFLDKLKEDHAVAPELKWDLWLGPAPYRPFNPMYLPNAWRRWIDFGTGTLGDYNCHYLDPVAWALDLGLPSEVEANPDAGYAPKINRQSFPNSAEIRWLFPARGKRQAVTIYWHIGAYPPIPKGWNKDERFPTGGGVITGSQGSIVFGALYASLPGAASTGEYKPVSWGTPGKVRLIPEDLDKSYKRPDKTIPRVVSHWVDWVESAKARKPAGSHFGFGGLLTQVALLGNIACRNKGKILRYDEKQGKFTNDDAANKLFQRPYREGWKLPV